MVRKFISHDLSIGGERVELGTELGAELGTELELGAELELGEVVGQILSPNPQVLVSSHTEVEVVKMLFLPCQLQFRSGWSKEDAPINI